MRAGKGGWKGVTLSCDSYIVWQLLGSRSWILGKISKTGNGSSWPETIHRGGSLWRVFLRHFLQSHGAIYLSSGSGWESFFVACRNRLLRRILSFQDTCLWIQMEDIFRAKNCIYTCNKWTHFKGKKGSPVKWANSLFKQLVTYCWDIQQISQRRSQEPPQGSQFVYNTVIIRDEHFSCPAQMFWMWPIVDAYTPAKRSYAHAISWASI